MNLTDLAAWQALVNHQKTLVSLPINRLFTEDSNRTQTFAAQAADIHLDYSKNRLNSESLELLFKLARTCDVESQRDAMFAGKPINLTEKRPALHTALRRPIDQPLIVDGHDVMPEVDAGLQHMRAFATAVRDGSHVGHSGQAIKTIINIGIGGSDLGPAMAHEALKFYTRRDLTFHFVSNVDASHLSEALRTADPETTLFIVASKKFTTDETMTNAASAKTWLLDHHTSPSAVAKHFVAISANTAAVQDFGIDPANTFKIWDWVGGRYSLPGAIGLSLMIAIGPDNFDDFLNGFHKIDQHFVSTPLESNLPVILGLIDIWNINFWGAQSLAILPYAQYLHRFPAYLQQLVMESNGKSLTRDGQAVTYATAPVVWGVPGTDSQHSVNQLLHQGTPFVPADFIGFAEPLWPLAEHHRKLLANLQAQTEALAFGNLNTQQPHLNFSGNRPSNTMMLAQLTPNTLGQLIALYEHRVFVQGAIWDINSFDQFGVELGKQLARQLLNKS